jgi:hypothetical protein
MSREGESGCQGEFLKASIQEFLRIGHLDNYLYDIRKRDKYLARAVPLRTIGRSPGRSRYRGAASAGLAELAALPHRGGAP